MLPTPLTEDLRQKIAAAAHPRELAVDIMLALQAHVGYLSDAAVAEAADLLGMTPVEIDELATFYTFIYREPVGRYVIHVCASVICWMNGADSLAEHLSRRLGIAMGETTPDGLFTLLPVCCIGYCDRSPAILVNQRVYGPLTPASLDELLQTLKSRGQETAPAAEASP